MHWVLKVMQPVVLPPFFSKEEKSAWLRKEAQRERRQAVWRRYRQALSSRLGVEQSEDTPFHEVGGQGRASWGTRLPCALSAHTPERELAGGKHSGAEGPAREETQK